MKYSTRAREMFNNKILFQKLHVPQVPISMLIVYIGGYRVYLSERERFRVLRFVRIKRWEVGNLVRKNLLHFNLYWRTTFLFYWHFHPKQAVAEFGLGLLGTDLYGKV